MKKIIALLILIALTSPSFSQLLDSTNYTARNDLLKKSRNQKTIGMIALIGGAAAVGIGALIHNSNSLEEYAYGVGLMIGGGVSMLASVPFFIASGKNNKKAMTMIAGIDRERAMTMGAYRSTFYPAVSIKFCIR